MRGREGETRRHLSEPLARLLRQPAIRRPARPLWSGSSRRGRILSDARSDCTNRPGVRRRKPAAVRPVLRRSPSFYACAAATARRCDRKPQLRSERRAVKGSMRTFCLKQAACSQAVPRSPACRGRFLGRLTAPSQRRWATNLRSRLSGADQGRGNRSQAGAKSLDPYRSIHGFMTAKPTPSNSETFLVARAAPRERVMAAICAANWLIGRPDLRRSAAIEP